MGLGIGRGARSRWHLDRNARAHAVPCKRQCHATCHAIARMRSVRLWLCSPRSLARSSSASELGTIRAPSARRPDPTSTARQEGWGHEGGGRGCSSGSYSCCRNGYTPAWLCWLPRKHEAPLRKACIPATHTSPADCLHGRRPAARTSKLDEGRGTERVLNRLRLHILAVAQHNRVLGAACRWRGSRGERRYMGCRHASRGHALLHAQAGAADAAVCPRTGSTPRTPQQQAWPATLTCTPPTCEDDAAGHGAACHARRCPPAQVSRVKPAVPRLERLRCTERGGREQAWAGNMRSTPVLRCPLSAPAGRSCPHVGPITCPPTLAVAASSRKYPAITPGPRARMSPCCPSGTSCSDSGSTTLSCVPGVGRPAAAAEQRAAGRVNLERRHLSVLAGCTSFCPIHAKQNRRHRHCTDVRRRQAAAEGGGRAAGTHPRCRARCAPRAGRPAPATFR